MKGRAALFVGLWVVGVAGPGLARPGDFEAALQEELRALTAERDALRRALDEATEAGRSAETALERELESLTASLARLPADITADTAGIPGQERVRSLEQEVRRTERLTDQMRAWLHARGSTVAEAASVDAIFRDAVRWLEARGPGRVVTTPVYDEDGKERARSVLRIGQVAAVALEERPRPLVLADDGSYRAAPGWSPRASVVTPAGRLVDAILYDPQEPSGPATYAEDGWLAWMQRGGPIMWPLALLGVLGAVISVERTFRLAATSVRLRSGRRAAGPAGSIRPADGILRPLYVAATEPDPAAGEERVAEALRWSQAALRRGLFFVAVVAAAAPLVGLLGTVTGMIGTFSVITEHGTGDPRLLSAGISEALLTTQLGLSIAVPALLAHALLSRWAHRLWTDLETLAVDILTRRAEGARG